METYNVFNSSDWTHFFLGIWSSHSRGVGWIKTVSDVQETIHTQVINSLIDNRFNNLLIYLLLAEVHGVARGIVKHFF